MAKSRKKEKLLIKFLLAFLPFFLVPAFAQEPPDYYNPYAPIFTDKQVYSWTDKVLITIYAPSWNANKYGVDSIGTQQGHHIKISTSTDSLEPYKLTETEPDSGIFRGHVILTGFSHDANGNGKIDTNPRTSGSGPTDGLLEANRDDGITISFEFADGVVLTHSAKIGWNVGDVEFAESVALAGENFKVIVKDADMNLNPESLDQVLVDVSSDSDIAGITVQATEVAADSGMFEVILFSTQTRDSSGTRLFALPGDTIYADYDDNTLPSQYSKSDNLNIKAESHLQSALPTSARVSITQVFLADSFGVPVTQPVTDNPIQIVGSVTNNQEYDQPFVYIIQVKDSSGAIVSLSWIQGKLTASQSLGLSQSWTPEQPGIFTVETYAWKSLMDPVPLATNSSHEFFIQQ